MDDIDQIPRFSMPPIEDFQTPFGQGRTGNVDDAFDDFSPEGIAGGAAPAEVHPFQVVDKSISGSAKISIRSGSVNDTTPAAIDYEDIDYSTVYNLSNGWTNVFLKVTVGVDLGLSAAEIEFNAGFPSNTNSVGYIRIAAVNVVDNAVVAINQHVRANVSYVYGGDSIHLFFS